MMSAMPFQAAEVLQNLPEWLRSGSDYDMLKLMRQSELGINKPQVRLACIESLCYVSVHTVLCIHIVSALHYSFVQTWIIPIVNLHQRDP
jgi:hypothetical protein